MSQKPNKEKKRLYIHAKSIYKPRKKFCVQEVTNIPVGNLVRDDGLAVDIPKVDVKVRLDYPHLVDSGKANITAYRGTGITSPYFVPDNSAELPLVFTARDTVQVQTDVPEIQLVRKTSTEHTFRSALGSSFNADNVDAQNTQLLHIAQEIIGGITAFKPFTPNTQDAQKPPKPTDPVDPIVPDKVNNKFYIAVSSALSDTTVYSLNYAFDNNIKIKIPKGTYSVKAIDHRALDNIPIVITNLHPKLNTVVDLYSCNIPVENWYKGGTNTLTKVASNIKVINGELQYIEALPENPVYIITNNNVFAIPLEDTSYEKTPKEGTIYEVEEDSSSLVPVEHPYLNYVWCNNDDIEKYKKGIVLSTPVATLAGNNYYMATEDVPYLVCAWEFSDNTIKPKGYWNKFKFLYPVQYGKTYYKDFLEYGYETKSYSNSSADVVYGFITKATRKNRVLLLGIDTSLDFNDSSFPYYNSSEPIYQAKFPEDTPKQLLKVSGITEGIDCPYDIDTVGGYVYLSNINQTYGYTFNVSVKAETNEIRDSVYTDTRGKFLCGIFNVESSQSIIKGSIPPNTDKELELLGYNVNISHYIDKQPIGDIIDNSVLKISKNNKHHNIFDYYFKALIIDTCNALYNAKDSSSVYSKYTKQDYTAYKLLVQGLEHPDYVARREVTPLAFWEQTIYKYE